MVELNEGDARLVATLLRYLNKDTSSDDAARMAEACGYGGSQFPEMFRRLMDIADHLSDE